MKTSQSILLVFIISSLGIFASCGDSEDDDPDLTNKEILIEALTSASWTIDLSETDVSAATGSYDESTFTLSFGTASDVAFTLGGDVSAYISGGTFKVSETGTISDVTVTTATDDLKITSSSFTVDATQTTVTMNFTTEANARVSGIGGFTLVFRAS